MITLAKKAALGFLEIPLEFRRLLTGRYPAFVTQYTCSGLRDEVPVFMFHSVQEAVFSRQLEYLKKNGYKTLSLNNFIGFLEGKYTLEHPSVLLTFDDGDKSWYEVAYPLLKAHGFHAIGFVVPAFIQEEVPEDRNRRWLSWPELVEMDQSGVMDIQSHTYGHQRIFITPKLVDFFHPQFGRDKLGMDIPWIQEHGRASNCLAWGTPIYQMAPLMAGKPPLGGFEDIQKACASWVESHGGETFFEQPDWRKTLTTYHQSVLERHQENMRPLSQEVYREFILDDLTRSKKILEDKLDKPIHSLCYPWGAGSELAVQISKEAGYTSNFWVTAKRRSNQTGNSPFFIPRLKDDYLFRLPGQERKSLLDIFKMKLKRRIQKIDIYS